jgi:hypothetical protein
MGLATAINFQPTGGGKAAITGDFVMIASEVNPVIRALREHGIEVTSLHNHLLADEPRLFFMHFWAVDDAATLARGLRAALDRTNVQRLPRAEAGRGARRHSASCSAARCSGRAARGWSRDGSATRGRPRAALPTAQHRECEPLLRARWRAVHVPEAAHEAKRSPNAAASASGL